MRNGSGIMPLNLQMAAPAMGRGIGHFFHMQMGAMAICDMMRSYLACAPPAALASCAAGHSVQDCDSRLGV